MKRLLSTILATSLLLTATACGKGAEATPSEVPSEDVVASEEVPAEEASAGGVTLNTVSMFGGTDPTGEYYQAIISDYEAESGVKVDDVSSTSDETWKASVVADFQVGNEPDVLFYFTGVDAASLIETGKLVDVETIRAEYPEYGADIKESAMGFMEEPDGKTYALPIRGFWEGLFVNKDLFEAQGLELPTDWATFETAVKAFAETDIVPVAVSFADVPHYWIEHLILAAGGIDEHRKTLDPEKPAPDSWVEGLDILKELNDMGAFSPDAIATNNDATSQLFRDKKAAMLVDGSWFAGGVTDQENTTVVPFPSYFTDQKEPSDIIGGFSNGFYITTAAWEDPEKREAAVNFVMKMTSKESIAEFAKVGGAPAADIEVPEGLTPLQTAGAAFSGAANDIDMPVDSRLNKEAWNYIVSNVSNIVDGSTDARTVLDEAAKFNK
ncbi:MAG: ABC transporter substrate-binding protein [Lachnospirales bacterium]